MKYKPKLIYYSTLSYQPKNLSILEDNFKLVTLKNPSFDKDNYQDLIEAEVILAPLGYFFGKEKIDKCKSLKVIASNTTGHGHIDVDYAKNKGIEVITLKDDQKFLDKITPTAELTFGLIIALTRNLVPAMASVADKMWRRRLNPSDKMLSRMSIGIVGLGRLGFKVAKMALSFDMKVQYYDPFVNIKYPGIVKVNALEKIVSQNDIITIHVPHEKETERMFDKNIFSHFKYGSYVINTSRGELVDSEELLNSLRNKQIKGAAIDVFETEFIEEFETRLVQSPLWKYSQENNNLLITPHIGGSTKDAWEETEGRILERIIQYFSTKAFRSKKNSDITIEANSTIVFIPARGGSKTIPLKNLVKLKNQPLLSYVINAAKKASDISDIVISTDNEKIRKFALDKSVSVDTRHEKLSGDNVPTVEVILDFLEKLKSKKKLPEYIVLLEPTSPFVDFKEINKCVSLIKVSKEFDSIQTTTEVSHNSHAYNQRYLSDSKGSLFVFPEERTNAHNKQKKPDFFIHGNLRVIRTSSLIKYKCIFGKYSYPVKISKIRSFDVDGPEDLEIAEAILSKLDIISN